MKPGNKARPTVKTAPQSQPVHAAATNTGMYVFAGAIILVAVFAVYGPALNGPFLLDDTTLPYMQPGYATAPLIVWLKGVRPMLMLTYWMSFQSSGTGS